MMCIIYAVFTHAPLEYGLLNSIYALEENYVYETENLFSVYAGYSLFILRMTLRLNFTHDAQNLPGLCRLCKLQYALRKKLRISHVAVY
jgi:hypothetical protein